MSNEIGHDLVNARLVKLPALNDERGVLIPLTDVINPTLLRRSCHVSNFSRGTIRGLHYHKEEWKIYYVLSGAAKFISAKIPESLIDQDDANQIREYLAEHAINVRSFVMSDRSPSVLVIPAWHANGWISLEEGTSVIFHSNLTFEEAANDDYRYSPDLLHEKYWSIS